MKKILLLVMAAVFIAFSFVGCAGGDENGHVFSVSDVADDPMAFTGEITINGLVMGLSENDPSLFGIEDPRRRSCCAPVILLVMYTGEGPTPGDVVNVAGSWDNSRGRIIFRAVSVEIVV